MNVIALSCVSIRMCKNVLERQMMNSKNSLKRKSYLSKSVIPDIIDKERAKQNDALLHFLWIEPKQKNILSKEASLALLKSLDKRGDQKQVEQIKGINLAKKKNIKIKDCFNDRTNRNKGGMSR